MRVLIVDDNPDDRELVLHQLKADYPDAEAVLVMDEKRLQEALAEQEPALVITDLHLGWTDGFKVFNELKRRYPDCPAIMFTGTGDEASAVEAIKAGLDDYVVKSARHLVRLRTSIRQVIEGAERRHALKQREDELRRALEHKDLLLRELHHRVKNNIQMVTSLLWLHARRTRSQEARAELQDLLARVQVLGQVQARIYETDELDRVNIGGALQDVTGALVEAHGGDRVKLEVRADDSVSLPLQRATPLALVIYEIVLNALKHGFRASTRGRLSIELSRNGEGAEILVSDDGAGYDPAAVEAGIRSKLIEALAREAGAELQHVEAPGRGTAVQIRIK